MKKSLPSLLVVISLLAGGSIRPSFGQVAVAGKSNRVSPGKPHTSRSAGGVEARIRRVENGVLLPAIIKGAPPVRLKLADRMRYYDTQGVSIAVINGGRIEWARGYGVKEAGRSGRVTTETLFSAGSISKPVTAMAALNFVESGKLNLDEDVNNKLVSWKVPENEFTRQSKVTLRRLLTHNVGPAAGRRRRQNPPLR